MLLPHLQKVNILGSPMLTTFLCLIGCCGRWNSWNAIRKSVLLAAA